MPPVVGLLRASKPPCKRICSAAKQFDNAARAGASKIYPRELPTVLARPSVTGGPAHARLFIGPMHLAAAVGTPCVAIFAARNIPRQWFPYGAHHRILYHRVECAGCVET